MRRTFLITLLCVPATFGQLAFEVATVKAHPPGPGRIGFETQPGGRFVATNVTLRMLISFAYHVPFQSGRLIGGDDWTGGEPFDIEGRPAPDAIPSESSTKQTQAKVQEMVRTLLAQRFHLEIRREQKELPVYAIVTGRGGPKLKKSEIPEQECAGPEPPKICHSFHGGIGTGVFGEAVTVADLANFASNWSDRPVVDRSGVAGLYNIKTEGWTAMTPRSPGDDSAEARRASDPEGRTLFSVFDLLGLKLVAQKAPLDVITIERAERPSAN